MRVAFLGTPSFAVPALRALLDRSYEVCCVVTQPDRPAGRGNRLRAGPVKILAEENGIPVHQPERLRDGAHRALFEALGPDFVVTAAYGQILPGWLLRSARIAPINIHASLLPRYRGASPIAHAILEGETTTGVTTMWMSEGLDAGPILMRRAVPIPVEATLGELTEELADVGAALLVETMEALRRGEIRPVPQDESLVTWAPRVTKDDARVSWERPAAEIHNRIRALNPWPVATTLFDGQPLRLWRCRLPEDAAGAFAPPGTLLSVTKDALLVQCGGGTALQILQVQLPAKGRVGGREFANGARLQAGRRLFGPQDPRPLPI